MAADARTKIVLELAAEFVEEHVRTCSALPFGMSDVRRSLATMLQEAEVAIELKSGDDTTLASWLDSHPFLLKQAVGAARAWKPGLNTGALKRA